MYKCGSIYIKINRIPYHDVLRGNSYLVFCSSHKINSLNKFMSVCLSCYFSQPGPSPLSAHLTVNKVY